MRSRRDQGLGSDRRGTRGVTEPGRRGVQIEHRPDAILLLVGHPEVDPRETTASPRTTAVEGCGSLRSDAEIEAHLLLDREFSADPIASGDGLR